MKERNILAGFRTMESAEQAAKQLQQAGFKTVQVSHIGEYPGGGLDQLTNPITGEIPSLGSLSLDADFPSGRNASILAAADPDASGLSDGGQDSVGPSFLLTAVVPENRSEEASQILRSCGGQF
ncbi:hypothetical protein [Brevibacillus fulvus]|uniref:Uncharacterized protein n=1 Tax=Brevibacillus fulvus TaxID=1125967 RepID=A0A939BQM5_9BACL|nr:hypothetical protein [Brevibacillus fulvus]MBM7591795.1 hypothetical protein [Brevibacillus fulvus]